MAEMDTCLRCNKQFRRYYLDIGGGDFGLIETRTVRANRCKLCRKAIAIALQKLAQ